VIVDGRGVPLVVRTSPAHVHDSRMLPTLLKALPALPGRMGRPRKVPRELYGDAAYGGLPNRVHCALRNITPFLARSRRLHGSGLGRVRYVVEQTLANFGQHRRLKLCYEKRGEHFQAFHELAASLLCFKRLRHAG
jgi:hypothetical protein